VGLPAVVLIAVLVSEPWSATAIGVGLAAGLAAAIGLLALYSALAAGSMGIVTGITGVAVAGFALAFDAAMHNVIPTPLQGVGVATALAAGLLATIGGWSARRAIVLALFAGIAFGGCFVLFDLGAGNGPLWMLGGARATASAILGLQWVMADRTPIHRIGFLLIGAGLLDTAANGLMILAITLIPVGLAASVAAVAPPIVTMLLAHIVLREALPARGYVAFGLACVGIMLIVFGW